MCVCFRISSQGFTGHDAVDQITETWGEWHQHYHCWLCGARRIHQCRHHPQLSHGRWWWWCHLRACGGECVWEHGRHHHQPPLLLLLLPVAGGWGSVFSLFSLWHLFQEGSCTAPFTLFRAIVKWEVEWKRGLRGGQVGIRRNSSGWFGLSAEREREIEREKGREILSVSYFRGSKCCCCVFFNWDVDFLYLLCCKNNCFYPLI